MPKNNTIREIKIALAGNPNCGKTTLFNQLTGSSQYVGNWAGVTVEKKQGRVNSDKYKITAVDLPGIYSLSPYTPEEIVSRDCLLNEEIDVIVNIVDATNIERNLYLTTQLLELDKPLVIALNMMDILKKNGETIDIKILESGFGVPIVPISASKNEGINFLIETAYKIALLKSVAPKDIYSSDISNVLLKIEKILKNSHETKNLRFKSVKLFEGDNLAENSVSKNLLNKINDYKNEIPITEYFDREMIIADQRYKYICRICKKAVHKKYSKPETISDKIDRIATGKFTAIPVFILLLFSIFFITFGSVGGFFCDITNLFLNENLSALISSSLKYIGASEWAVSLVCDGIIAGIGSVLSFLPQILILFALLSILEDSGYMARATFIMDRPMRKIGLSGRSFVPMLMGFGCSVPAIMSARTLNSIKDRRLTILITPFMSCSAKMPVYLLIIGLFFAQQGALVILAVYMLGIISAILTALLFKNTILKGESSPFLMELPPYRLPTAKSLWLHIWERLKDFLTKAGTVLLGASIIVWFLQSFDLSLHFTENNSDSILAVIGKAVSPIFTLCGFGDWRAVVALLTGIAAKESIVSTLAVLYDGSVLSDFTPLTAFSFLCFVLLYTPCIAAISTIHREMQSRKWTAISIIYQFVFAWFVSACVYQFGMLIINIL